jgi:hypothetical protein
MIQKPSDKEAEYFIREEMKKLRQQARETRDQIEKAEIEKARELHYMKCPKCGMDLSEIDFRGIKVDKCFCCEGIYLDKGELEAILKSEDRGIMKKVLKVFSG